jgi:hypothetical protein
MTEAKWFNSRGHFSRHPRKDQLSPVDEFTRVTREPAKRHPGFSRYLFTSLSGGLLALMIILSGKAGITCDEPLHYNQSSRVIDFFQSAGKDARAIQPSPTHLEFYGQSFDVLVTYFSIILKIDDIYRFRHLMSAIAGWLTIMVTALFAVWLKDHGAGIIVLLLFAISPVFMGHSLNNLKDVPFAFSYISATFLTVRLFFDDNTFRFSRIIFLILAIGLSISIRAGGLLLICYLFLFYILSAIHKLKRDGGINPGIASREITILVFVSLSAYAVSILPWPFALANPVKNVLASLKLMTHFPDTFRQLFEGKTEWSDFMPWYYLPKSMVITIPVIVFAGLAASFFYSGRMNPPGRGIIMVIILFTILFPPVYAVIKGSNIYSSWRQFLFIYPAIVLLSALGFRCLPEKFPGRSARALLLIAAVCLAAHPVKFMVRNHPYHYLYHNQLVGGLKGAYGNYETDYYYTGQTEASEWLINYLKMKGIDSAIIGVTFGLDWQFRNYPSLKVRYIRNSERSMHDWDYAIITNRYIPVCHLLNNRWPPGNAIHVIRADGVPVCAVLERRTRSGYLGNRALEKGRKSEAICFFREALRAESDDEMIFYNFARAMFREGKYAEADSLLRKGLEINPGFEPILMFLGNIAKGSRNDELAAKYYEEVISGNRKYFEAYVELAGIIAAKDVFRARHILRDCLKIQPGYKPALLGLADTYRERKPEIAEKYDKLAGRCR